MSIHQESGGLAHASSSSVVCFARRNGMEVGVYSDGSTCVSIKTVAKLCGVDRRAIQERIGCGHADTTRAKPLVIKSENLMLWDAKTCSRPQQTRSDWARLLERNGYHPGSPKCDVIKHKGVEQHVVREHTYSALPAYYAIEHGSSEAVETLVAFTAAGGPRAWAHGLLNHIVLPPEEVMSGDRLAPVRARLAALQEPPRGDLWSVPAALKGSWLLLASEGLPVGAHCSYDGSVAIHWSRSYRANLMHYFGAPVVGEVRYPKEYPQGRRARPCFFYVPEVRPHFTRFCREVYFRQHFAKYLNRLVRKGAIDEALRQKLQAFALSPEMRVW